MSWWIWVVVGVVLLGLEFASTTMHIGLFGVGAFAVALLVGLGVEMPLWGQLLTFTAVSLFAFFFLRPVIVRKLGLNKTKHVVDSMVGEAALAMEDIPVAGVGRAEMRGTTWSARNVGETGLTRGQRCVVSAVEGLVLHVRAA